MLIPTPIEKQVSEGDEEEEVKEDEEPLYVGTRVEGELKVYTRRRRKEGKMNTSTVPLASSSLMSRLASTSIVPIVMRRTSRSNAGVPPDRYGFPHDIA